MKRHFYLMLGVPLLAFLAQAAQDKPKETEKPKEKPKEVRTLKVKLNYTGAGTVDEKHKILVFVFDSPDFVQGGVMPVGTKVASAKNETVVFPDLTASPLYVVASYDPSGAYDGMSGPPPSGSSMAIYGASPGQPDPINIEAGKTAEVQLPFDDSFKMP